jgi:hypothetical protein
VVGALAAKGRGLRIPQASDGDAVYLAPEGWGQSDDAAWVYTWKGGGMRRNGTVEQNGRPMGELLWRNGKFTLLDAKGKRLDSLTQPEKPGELLLAWGVSRLLEKE